MTERRGKQQLLGALFVALLSLPALMPTIARADATAQVLGATIGEWSARWWQWAMLIPADRNPMTDPDGTFCGEAQSGPVWFLAGVMGEQPPVSETVRNCTIPKGKSIFFPIYNYIWVQTSLDVPGNTEADYRQCVSATPPNGLGCPDVIATAGGDLEATLDGVPIVFDFRTPIVRAQSPLFMLRGWPMNNVWGADPAWFEGGKNGQSVSDGFWVMLPPLSPGDHTLSFRAGDGTNDWQNVTYNLTVQSKVWSHH